MCTLSTGVLVQQRFHKNRTLATGIAMLGNGIGNILAPIWMTLLLPSYGWRGAVLIHAGLVLNGCVLAMFMLTPKVYRPQDKSSESGGRSGCLKSYFKDVANFSSLADPGFALFCISQALSKFSLIGCTRHLTNKAILEGFPKTRAAFLVAIVSVGLFVARIPSGLLADSRRVNRIVLVGVVLIISGVLVGCLALPDNYAGYAVLSVAFGATIGMCEIFQKEASSLGIPAPKTSRHF